jgi:Flp pilus assembly pilin Flp
VIDFFNRLLEEEHGLTTVEYAVSGSLISVALVGAFMLLSGGVEGTILNVASALSGGQP